MGRREKGRGEGNLQVVCDIVFGTWRSEVDVCLQFTVVKAKRAESLCDL